MIRTLTKPDAPTIIPNLVDMCCKGWVECLSCGQQTHPVPEFDPIDQEPRAACVLCGSRNLVTHPPTL